MKTFLAVDFGTTQSSVAILTESSTREPQVVEINDGQRAVKAVATALQLDITGNIAYFGSKAVEKSEEAPERTFQNFKVFTGDNGREYQDITGQEKYTPDKLALMYLTHICKQLEEHHFNGAKLSSMAELSCVIGCPSDWSEVRKGNLKAIALSAGFPNVRLCDEPIGVIYYNHFFGGLKFSKSQQILVYDFGGGTTDIAIARIDVTDGKIKPSVLAVGGLPNLGGSNFDEAISAHYMSVNNYDLSILPVKDQLFDRWAIGLAARNVKEELSGKASVERTINRLKVTGGKKPQKLTLTREEFMSVCAPLIERFDEPVYDTLTSAGLSADDIDAVILAGGSSAMPFVKEKMSGIFSDKKIIMSPSTEVVAQGLAVFGRAEEAARTKQAVITASQMGQGNLTAGVDSVWEEDDDDDDEEESFLKRHKKALIGVAAVFVISAALVFSYIKYEEQKIIQEQARIKAVQDAEKERLRIAQEEAERKKAEAEEAQRQAERDRQAAQRAREEAERRAREASRRRYLGKSTIQSIIKSYGFERSYIVESLMLNTNSEILGIGSQAMSPYIVFTVDGVFWHRGYSNGKPVKVQGASYVGWSYEQLRNNVTDEQVRRELRNLPKAQNAINAVLEIKNY